ncbi:hypothetical protein O181_039341 [Austropuccinia psidii MF-1]|uniref:Retrotransposon gag domain-containing protein n=1 Tax=Austropuccinia psidii MF-1 TaxID=1389203 RepID=A0A9Q3DFS4_9BASI|nr:hypothetical protein [Austropuccinia psidii MF-1]
MPSQMFLNNMKSSFSYTSFLTGRAAKWIDPYLSNLINKDPTHLLKSWSLFKYQLFTLFGDPNDFQKEKEELDGLRMKEGGHVSLYIAYFRNLVSRIGNWGERTFMHHYRKGLVSRILDQFTSHPSIIYSLQDLMDVTLELDTRYYEKKKQKNNSHKKKIEASK